MANSSHIEAVVFGRMEGPVPDRRPRTCILRSRRAALSSFKPDSSLGAGAFATPAAVVALGHTLGVDFVPFNVQDLAGNVCVTYAPAGHAAQTMATAGEGAVAEFSETGVLENTIVGSQLASPWGVAIAPTGFGKFGGDLRLGSLSIAEAKALLVTPPFGAAKQGRGTAPAARRRSRAWAPEGRTG
jgi:hypothetical protein